MGGWCVGLALDGVCLRERGGNCLKYLKSRWSRKEGRKAKILKRGQARARGGCLKNWGPGNPLRTIHVEKLLQKKKRLLTLSTLKTSTLRK